MKRLERYTVSTDYVEKEMKTESGDMVTFTVPKQTYHFQNEDYENEEDAIKAEKLFIRNMFPKMVECPECYCETCIPEEGDTENTMCDACLKTEGIKKRIWNTLAELEADFEKIDKGERGNSYFWELVRDIVDD